MKQIPQPNPLIIAALHLPPFPASGHPDAQPIDAIRDFALRNAETAVRAGIPGLAVQDMGDRPFAPHIQPHTTAGIAIIGDAVRRAFPELYLGVSLLSHGAREPLAIAQAINAQFVRLKVYIGAMVKMEGLLEGCAYEAIQYRQAIGAEQVTILADIYDRTGEPLARTPLAEEARQATLLGRADGLILTGKSQDESYEMLDEVRAGDYGVPLLIGGGVSAENAAQALQHADGVIISTALKPAGKWTRQSLLTDWSAERASAFMQAVKTHSSNAG